MLIIIVGFMGSGKTTIGKQLADALDMEFYDLDDLIQEEERMDISEIFNKFGQDHFRTLENKMVNSLSSKYTNAVIATGGGTPCYNNNIEKLNKIGTTFYLQLDAEHLFQRLQNEAAFRPLLKGKNDSEMLETISELLHYRIQFYEKATYTVKGDSSPEEVTGQILYLINE